MSSCDDDFPLIRDDHRHRNPPPPHHRPHAVNSFPSHRFAVPSSAKAPPHLAVVHHNHHRALISSPKDDDGEYAEDDYGRAFEQPNVPPCFDDASLAGEGGGGDEKIHGKDADNEEEKKVTKRRDREELSDEGAPLYGLAVVGNKKSRSAPTAALAASSSSGDYRKDREEWSDSAIGCLLDAYTDKYVQLNRGNLRGRDWEEVATIVSERCDKQKSCKSVEQCKNKVDNLKKRYKAERQRLSSGSLVVSHWPWFKKMEQIVGFSSPSSYTKAASDEDKSAVVAASGGGASGSAALVKQPKRYTSALAGTSILAPNMKVKSMLSPRWRRVVFKISGSTFAGEDPQNIDPKVTMMIAKEIAIANHRGVEVAIVVGGRNFFCGETWAATTGVDRITAYQIGMMATVMNSIMLQACLEKIGIPTRVLTAFMMQKIAEPYIRRRAIHHLEKARVVIFGGVSDGTGSPLISTDTAAALRASEINADAVLKGTNGDIIYDCHSRDNTGVFEHISFRDYISRGFNGMDMTAINFCEENNLPVVLFNLLGPGNISRALCGEQVGTYVDQAGAVS